MTSYSYPTWADILGREFDYYENWGEPGAGNLYIFNSIVECLLRNNVTENDTLIIMWSSVARIDSYQFNNWAHTVGQYATRNDNSMLSCPHGYEIISYALFNAIDQLLESKKLNYHMLTWTGYDTDSDVGKLYSSTLNKITKTSFNKNTKKITKVNNENLSSLYDKLAGKSWPSLSDILAKKLDHLSNDLINEIQKFNSIIEQNRYVYYVDNEVDFHPTPLQHLEMLNKYFPIIKISPNTVSYIRDIDHKYINNIEFEFKKSKPKERL